MRRGHIVILFAISSGLLSVLLAVAVNVATGGTLPDPLGSVSWLAWPAVALLAVATAALAVWQERRSGPGTPHIDHPRGTPPAELPAAPIGFAGRTGELAAVGPLLASGHRVLAVIGPPGTGKSALALRIAHDRRRRFPAGQLYAALRGASAHPVAPEAILARFLGALGIPDEERRGSLDDLAARFRSTVADRRVLILLDDARDSDQVRPLLPGGRGCLVLVTSRRHLADLPNSVPLALGGLDDDEGRAVLASAIGDGRVAADPDGAARILRFCGGLPLAIRIAGARLRARPAWRPSDLAARMEDEGSRLDELRVGDRAVRSAFETSYAELSPVDRVVFRRAGSHPGQVFGTDAAAALAGLDEPTVAATLERLVDAQLVESPAAGRYRLHDLLRLFASQRLTVDEAPGDQDACLARLLDWLATHAQAGDWLARERDNVRAATERGIAAGGYERVWTLVSTVHPLLDRAGDHPDRLVLWRAAAAAAGALGDDRRRSRALRLVSTSYRQAGRVERALDPAAEAVTAAERLDDRTELARALLAYGEALRDLYRFEEARTALERALRIVSDLGDSDQEVAVRSALGTLYNQSWQRELAIPVLEPARALLSAEDSSRHVWVLLPLSGAYRLVGRRDEAAELIAHAVAMARRIGDEYALGYAMRERAWLAHDQGRRNDAARHARRALAIFEGIRHGTGVGLSYDALGEIAVAAGRHGEAIEAFDAAVARFERQHDRVRAAVSRLHRAICLVAEGRTTDARAEYEAAAQLLGTATTPEVQRLRERLREGLGDQPGAGPAARATGTPPGRGPSVRRRAASRPAPGPAGRPAARRACRRSPGP